MLPVVEMLENPLYSGKLSYEWYHGNITRQEAEKRITDFGVRKGAFLIRRHESSGDERDPTETYVISMVHEDRILHLLILDDTRGHVRVNNIECASNITDLSCAIEFLQAGVHCNLPCQLVFPVPKPQGSIRLIPDMNIADATVEDEDDWKSIKPVTRQSSSSSKSHVNQYQNVKLMQSAKSQQNLPTQSSDPIAPIYQNAASEASHEPVEESTDEDPYLYNSLLPATPNSYQNTALASEPNGSISVATPRRLSFVSSVERTASTSYSHASEHEYAAMNDSQEPSPYDVPSSSIYAQLNHQTKESVPTYGNIATTTDTEPEDTYSHLAPQPGRSSRPSLDPGIYDILGPRTSK